MEMCRKGIYTHTHTHGSIQMKLTKSYIILCYMHMNIENHSTHHIGKLQPISNQSNATEFDLDAVDIWHTAAIINITFRQLTVGRLISFGNIHTNDRKKKKNEIKKEKKK